jgi:hypothetical protein
LERDGVLIVSVKRLPLAVELTQVILRFRRVFEYIVDRLTAVRFR